MIARGCAHLRLFLFAVRRIVGRTWQAQATGDAEDMKGVDRFVER
jgi:hypothetical protein